MGKLIRALLDTDALVIAIDSKDIVCEARRIHNLSPVMCAALGRTLTAAAIMGAQLKNDADALTITINGGGPGGNIVACADSHPFVRGYAAYPQTDLPPNDKGKLDVSGAVGTDGFITVTKDLGFGEPYTGRCELITGEIAEDFVKYYYTSEQTPCAIALSVAVNRDYSIGGASGLAVFPLPGVSEKTLLYLENSIDAMSAFAQKVRQTDIDTALTDTFPGGDIEILDVGEAKYRCTCSREKLYRVVASMGREEILDMIEKDGGAELNCHFCGAKYCFSAEELAELIK